MKFHTPLISMALLAVATIGGCRESCCDVNVHPINGYAPTNAPPRASQVEFPDPTLTAGHSLTVSGVESLFLDDNPLTLTATSSDTMVVAVSMVGIDYRFSLTLDALSPGAAEVSIVATEPVGRRPFLGPQDPQQPLGLSATRTVNVTVVPGT